MTNSTSRRCLGARERAIFIAVAEAALPAGASFPAAGAATVDKLDRFISGLPPAAQKSFAAILRAIDLGARARHLRGFTSLSPTARFVELERWRRGNLARRFALRFLLSPLKVAHFSDPELFAAVGCRFAVEPPTVVERPRYVTERTTAAAEVDQPLELECDVVVVGSGAGGAVVAKELAELGHAVLLLEEGFYFDRRHFNGRSFEMQRKMYRDAGATFALGNAGIPIPTGRTVGGTTTINSGTCYRIPGYVLANWREADGLVDFTEQHLDPYFTRVESVLGVAEARPELLGGAARVIARGCDRLGYAHRPLRRNAPDCDGKGVCCFGCPTDAKRSTNISYVPLALKAGAHLFHGVKVTGIEVTRGRAVGVTGHTVDRRGGRKSSQPVKVNARAVVIACGALATPTLLLGNRLGNRSGELGKNLSIHPAVSSMARFDEPIATRDAIPQGYAIEEFRDEGLLFEGASTPFDIAMTATSMIGGPLVELGESFDRVAVFGFLVADTSRGRVRLVGGRQLITYTLNRRDLARLKRGQDILARVFFAAGADGVLPMVHGFDWLQSEADLARFRAANLRASDFDITAYHPLGTARMGIDPARSVVGPDHQSHDVDGLYIVDGSALPSSLAVNPQLTIMALATRAAERIDDALGNRREPPGLAIRGSGLL